MNISAFLEGTGNYRYPPGLDRMRSLLRALGDPQSELRFLHVAGTNGKGSTCACAASILQCAGYRTGLYTSPHIFRYNERIRVDGIPISDADFSEVLEQIQPISDAMDERPTTFELLTAAAFLYFKKQKCDIVVLEVGLGGRFDATNVIESPEVSVITPIGLDHIAQLGGTITAISDEKAGIIKSGCPVVNAAGSKAAEAVIDRVCTEKNAPLFRSDASRLSAVRCTLDGTVMTLAPYGEVTLPLLGSYQPFNALAAVTAVEAMERFPVSSEAIRAGLAAVSWQGRFELLRRKPDFILDGAHNAHGIRAAAESLQLYFPKKKIVFLLGVLADKNVTEMLDLLTPQAQGFVTVTPPSARAMDAGHLASELQKRGFAAECSATVEEAVFRAEQLAGESGVVCALGSLYFSGDVRTAVLQRKGSERENV